MADAAVAQPIKEEANVKQEPSDVQQPGMTDSIVDTEMKTETETETTEKQQPNGNGNREAQTDRKDDENNDPQDNRPPRGNKRIKSSYDDLPESNDEHEIRRQVDFYFSDSNLPTDKFLLTETGGHKNNPFPLKEIHNFKRMRHFQPFTAVLDAVRKSKILNITDDGMITRKTPLSEKFTLDIDQNKKLLEDESMPRSIYAKGFGREHKGSQTEIEDFFKVFGDINAVRLRRTNYKDFKGSVFVEFADPAVAEDFLALENKPTFKGEELMFKSKRQYCDDKIQDIKDGKVKPAASRGGSRGGKRDNDNWKERRDQDQRGRGRGRGDRGGRGRGRGGRQDRNRSRDRRDRGDESNGQEAAAAAPTETANGGAEAAPVVKTEAGAQPQNDKKRAREDDAPGVPEAESNKKVKTEE